MEGDPAHIQGPFPEIRPIAVMEHRPIKRFGQHFLVDRKVIGRILERATLGPSDRILEIGPGKGALTLPLSRRVDRVLAVEKDRDLVERLMQRLHERGVTNVDALCGDILRFDFTRLEGFAPDGVHVVGNLPYNISSPVLETLIRQRRRIHRAVLMFQKEVADRLAATPGGRNYGALTVLIGYHARIAPLAKVGKEAFRPRPRVESAVVELDFDRPHPARAAHEACFQEVVRGAFAHRRKTLLNTLSIAFPGLDRQTLERVLAECGIEPIRRAETLSIDEYLGLAAAWPTQLDKMAGK